MAALLVEIGVLDFQDEMVARYEDVARQFPTEAGVLAVVANSYVAGEQFEKGVEYADKAIAIEAVTRPVPQAWWVKGEALVRLERIDEAIVAFETAIGKEPKTEFTSLAHRSLADVLEDRGDAEGAASHRAQADAVDAELAAAAQGQ
jgi:tetratricopeptide (TPR) repeat protein